MAMIEHIQYLRSVGRFDSTTAGAQLPFSKLTLLYRQRRGARGQESDPARLCFAAGPPTSDRGPKTGVFLGRCADAGRPYDLNGGDSLRAKVMSPIGLAA
jgi:hypothetical protein